MNGNEDGLSREIEKLEKKLKNAQEFIERLTCDKSEDKDRGVTNSDWPPNEPDPEYDARLRKSVRQGKIHDIAMICHDANRAYQKGLGHNQAVAVSPLWDNEPPAVIESLFLGVQFHIENPDATPSTSHEKWMKHRLSQGWTLGETKDEAAKTHPNLVPYDQLPEAEQHKDALFKAIVDVFRGMV